jgi:hypothetical protein
MGGFVQAIGDGITGLIAGAFDTIGGVLRGMVAAGDRALPAGLLWVVLFVLAVGAAWTLAKR